MADKKSQSAVTSSQYKVSLVIPCYNEENRIQKMLDGLQEFTKSWNRDYEIIVVDDGSKDATVKKIQESPLYNLLQPEGKFKILSPGKNQGKGFALKEGVLASSGTHILTLDADMSSRPAELNKWLASHQHKFSDKEIWIGSRELSDSKVKDLKGRHIAGKLFNYAIRLLTPLDIQDTQCGFKLYPAAVAKEIFSQLKTAGWAHDVELLYRAKFLGVKSRELPVTWTTMDGSKISVLSDGIKMFIQLMLISLRIKFEWFFITPFKEMKNKSSVKGNQPLFRFLFAAFAVFLFALMTTVSFHYGITGDDLDQKIYGEKVLDFYTTLGKDTSCLHVAVGNKDNLYLYGGMFNMISAAANRYIGGIDEYDMRHLINSMTGFLAILITGLLAMRIGNWMTGFFALVLLATYPQFFGQSMNNPKDIPFALGFVFSIYFFIKLVKELPRPSARTWIMSAIGIALTINMRIGGLMLIGILIAFVTGTYILSAETRKQITQTKSVSYLVTRIFFVTVAGYFGGLIFWPYGLLSPLSHPLEALKEQSNFSIGIGLLFDGKYMSSKEIPWYYIPKWIWITAPLVVLIPAMIQPVICFFKRKEKSFVLTLLILFAVLFPWVYMVYNKSPLYDGMRQFLFVVPLIAVLAALTWQFLITNFSQKIISYSAISLLLIGVTLPLRFCFANHPNEYVYFNEMIGGIKGAYGKFDTDYYMNSIRKTSEWFRHSDIFSKASSQHKILLATNTTDPVNWYFRNDTGKVKIVYVKWDAIGNPKTRGARDWDYGIFFSRDIMPGMLKAGTWPSNKAIYKNAADGVPLSVVIERTNKSDLYGLQALQKDSLMLAEKYFDEALKYNPQNEEAAYYMTQIKLQLKKYNEAVSYAAQYLQLFPDNSEGYSLLGICYAYNGDFQQSATSLSKAIELNPMNYQAYMVLGQLYQQRGDNQTAQQYLQQGKQIQQMLQEQ